MIFLCEVFFLCLAEHKEGLKLKFCADVVFRIHATEYKHCLCLQCQ